MQKRGLLIQQFDSCEEGALDQQEAAGDTGTELVVVAVRALKLGARDFRSGLGAHSPFSFVTVTRVSVWKLSTRPSLLTFLPYQH